MFFGPVHTSLIRVVTGTTWSFCIVVIFIWSFFSNLNVAYQSDHQLCSTWTYVALKVQTRTDRTDMLRRRFTRHKCCWNNAEVTFPKQCSSGENGSSGFFHISNVTNSRWNCVPGALLTLEVPNTCAFQKDSRCLYDAFMLCVLPSVNSQRLRLDLEHSAGLLETKVFVHGLFPRSEGHYGLHWFLYYTSQTQ